MSIVGFCFEFVGALIGFSIPRPVVGYWVLAGCIVLPVAVCWVIPFILKQCYGPKELTRRIDEAFSRLKGHELLKWTRVPLEKYGHPVPEEVLTKLILLRESCPTLRIDVEHTEPAETIEMEFEKQRAKLLRPDPFVVVTLGESEAYVAFWDENYDPEFAT
jgi:hypothetical protein